MSSDRDPNAIRLPDDVAQRLLARATELDDRSGRTSIDQLRRAATEAGISPAAFETALAELARGELGRPAARTATGIDVRGSWVTSPIRRVLLFAAAALSLLILGVGAVRMAQDGPEPVMEIEAMPMDVELVPAPRAPEGSIVPPTEAPAAGVITAPPTAATPAAVPPAR